jgi:ABC-type sugar transport system ATPase subunit
MRRTVNGILVGLGACATLSSGGCCLASSAPTPPPAVPSPNLAPPEPAPPGCPTIELAILGTWSREGFVEEYRAGGVYVLNGHEGTVRWLGEGRVFLDVPPDFHEEYTLALADRDLLLAADRGGVGTVYQRTSTPPTADASCWDVRDEIVGRWVGGQFRELYEPDGTYRVNDREEAANSPCSWCSGPRAAARARSCAPSRGSSCPTRGSSARRPRRHPACPRATATSPWSSRATRSTPTSRCATTSPSASSCGSTDEAEVAARIDEVAAMLGLDPAARPLPKEMSGGQRQRVAMGRAIARRPSLFLFDEPLSNLDAALRAQVRVEIKRLHAAARRHDALRHPRPGRGHDPRRPARRAQRAGASSSRARPSRSTAAPARRFVAGFLGSPAMNFLPAVATRRARHCRRPRRVPRPRASIARCPTRRRAGRAAARRAPPKATGALSLRVEVVEAMGFEAYAHGQTGDGAR